MIARRLRPLSRMVSTQWRWDVVEVAAGEQFGHAQDTVQRRADLVAHDGQELALRLGRPFRARQRDVEIARARLDLGFEIGRRALERFVGVQQLEADRLEHLLGLLPGRSLPLDAALQPFEPVVGGLLGHRLASVNSSAPSGRGCLRMLTGSPKWATQPSISPWAKSPMWRGER
jgi:hypothetical protein